MGMLVRSGWRKWQRCDASMIQRVRPGCCGFDRLFCQEPSSASFSSFFSHMSALLRSPRGSPRTPTLMMRSFAKKVRFSHKSCCLVSPYDGTIAKFARSTLTSAQGKECQKNWREKTAVEKFTTTVVTSSTQFIWLFIKFLLTVMKNRHVLQMGKMHLCRITYFSGPLGPHSKMCNIVYLNSQLHAHVQRK